MGYLKRFRQGLIIIQALLLAMALVVEARAQETLEAEVVATIPHAVGFGPLSVALSRDGVEVIGLHGLLLKSPIQKYLTI